MIMHSRYPELLLGLVGFERAPDRGWQIPFKHDKPKLGKLHVPSERIHALVVGSELNVHLDAKRSKRRHKSFPHSYRVDFVGYLLAGLAKHIDN